MAERLSKERLFIRCRHIYDAAQRWWRANGTPSVEGVERYINTSRGPVRVLEYGFQASDEATPVMFDLHGGGWLLLHADSDEYLNVSLARLAHVRIVAIDYPKGPDNPFPAALESIYEIMRLYSKGAPVGVSGHSAGGNMAAAICLLAQRRGDLSIAYQILDYPVLDLKTDAYSKPEPDPVNMPSSMSEAFTACYTGVGSAESDASDPLISPIFAEDAELSRVPPALIIVCGIDALRGEGLEYGRRLCALGAETELRDFPTMRHAFTNKELPETDEAIGYMADFIRRHI